MTQPPTHSAARAYAGAIFAVVVWGVSFIATKIGVARSRAR